LKSKHSRNNLEKGTDSSYVEQQLTRRLLTWIGTIKEGKGIKEERE